MTWVAGVGCPDWTVEVRTTGEATIRREARAFVVSGRAAAILIVGVGAAFSVLLAQWTPDYHLTASGVALTSFGNAHCVAANGMTVHVVWSDYRDGNAEIYYKRSVSRGETWGDDVRLTVNAGQSWYPSIACDGERLHVVWDDTRCGNLEVYYKYSPDGGITWSPDVRITQDSPWSWYPSVAAAGADVHMVCLGGGLVYGRSTDCGATWLPQVELSSSAYLTPGPSVAATEQGVHVAWVTGRDGNQEIYCKSSTDRGQTWSDDTRLTFDDHVSTSPCVAASEGDVHVVWCDERTGDGSEIFYCHSLDNGHTWTPEYRITTAPDWSCYPSVAASGDNVHVVWQDARTGDLEINYRRSTDQGETWGHDDWLTYDEASSYYPSIAVADSGLYVVWTDERCGGTDVFFKADPTGNPPSVTAGNRQPGPGTGGMLRVVPNPFSGRAVVSGAGGGEFEVRDVSGKLVAVRSGSRIGDGLPAGTYFLTLPGITGRRIKVVKSN